MGFDKLSAKIHGEPILRHTLKAFLTADSITSIIVVCPQERFDLLDGLPSHKPIIRIDGGENRQDSVAAGLAHVSSAYVAVHDGARPLIAPQDIDRCVAAASIHSAAALARRVTETLKRADHAGFSKQSISRDELWFMETPQVVAVELLHRAYAAVTAHNLTVTDEVSALEAINVQTKLVESSHPNLKITTPADLAVAEAIFI